MPSHRRQRRGRERVSAWLRADYSGRPVRGLPQPFAARPWRAGFGSVRACWEIHSARASAIDLRVIALRLCRSRLCRCRQCCCRRWRRRRSWRCGARELVVGLVALLPQIPALTFAVAVDAIVPVAARGGRALRRGQAAVRGGLGHLRGSFRRHLRPEIRHRGQIGPCHDPGQQGRDEFPHGTVRHSVSPATQHTTKHDA